MKTTLRNLISMFIIFAKGILLASIIVDSNRPAVNSFVLQELPLFRSERMEPRRAFLQTNSEYAPADNFQRDLRSYSFPRWNRLHSYWSKNELLQRLTMSNELAEGGNRQ